MPPIVLASLALTVPAAGGGNARTDLVASSHGKSVKATVGSRCVTEGTGTLCADTAYPLPIGRRLPVHRRGEIKLKFGEAPTEVRAMLRDKKSRSFVGLKVEGKGRERTALLERKLTRAADRLGVFVRYANGDDVDFEVGLKRHRHR